MARRTRTKSVAGLEIEPGTITAARVSVDGRITLDQVASAPLEAHVVRDGEVGDVEALTAALRALWRDHKGLGKRVRVGVANARTVVRVLDLPVLEDPKQLDALVRFHAEQELPMPLDSAVLDFQSVGTVEGPDGPRTRVVVAAARRDMVERVLAAVRAAGLTVVGIDLSAFAMLRALGRDAEPTVYVGVGGLTNLAVADGDVCTFTRVTGSGLDGMVVGLAERQQITLAEARETLLRVGLDAPLSDFEDDVETAAAARTVLTSGVRQIAGEVRSSLEFHQGQAAGAAPVERVVLTGPAARVPGFADAFGDALGLPVEVRTVPDGRREVPDAVDPVCASVAAGLAVAEVAA
jgi:type IV pilus assembly protein PilM